MTDTSILADDRHITKNQLRELVPVVDMTLWRWVRAGQFPAPVQIGGKNFWKLREVQQFLASRPAGYSRSAHGCVGAAKARKATAEASAS